MSYLNVLFTDPATGASPATQLAIRELVFPNLREGVVSATKTILATNVSASPAVTLTNLRFICKLINGLVHTTPSSRVTNELGLEAMVEKWVQARTGANPFQAIGGGYGQADSAANYLALSDLAPAASVQIDVRVLVPVGVSTARRALVLLGLCYKPV